YTIIDMATTYGKDVGISDTDLVLALLMTQVVAFPCSIAFGKISKRFKNGSLIQVSILAYFLIAVFALQLDKAWEFWFLAVCVAVFQGAIQALSRSYFAKIIPKEKSSEYFGFYDIFGKGAAFIGTMVMGISTMVSGSSRYGVAILSSMFLVGFFFFRKAEKEE
ncbi:MAG: MFS transporter, partial [Emergencia sp.]